MYPPPVLDPPKNLKKIERNEAVDPVVPPPVLDGPKNLKKSNETRATKKARSLEGAIGPKNLKIIPAQHPNSGVFRLFCSGH